MDKRYIVIRIPRLDGYKTVAFHIGVLLFGWANLAVLYAFGEPWLLDWFGSWLVVAIAATSIGLRLATDRPAFGPAAEPDPVEANGPDSDGAIYRGSTPHPYNFPPENFSDNFDGTELPEDYVSDFVGPTKGEWRRNFSQELDAHLRSRGDGAFGANVTSRSRSEFPEHRDANGNVRSAVIPARQAGKTAHLRAVDLPPDPEYTPPPSGIEGAEHSESGERTSAKQG